MIHELLPWRTLTRMGVPPLKVRRRPLAVGEVTVAVGAILDPELFPAQIRAQRLRQFYEQRRLEPATPVVGTRQYHCEQQAALVAPVVPVASRIVAEDLPAVEVPVEESADDAVKEEETARPKARRWRRPTPRRN